MQHFDPGPSPTFGEWLRARRIAMELTREQLAQRAFCSVVTVNKLQSNQLIPSAVLAEALAVALAVPEAQRAAFVRFARASRSENAIPANPPIAHLAQPNDVSPALPLPSAPALRVTALPAAVTSFVGRETELHQLTGLLSQPHVRLLTLTGPPGTGKTRLGLELARSIANEYPTGATFIALSPLADAALVLKAIVQQLGLNAATSESKSAREVLIDTLQHRRVLMLLDNFEHVLDAAPELAALLAALPSLKLIVTSREPLRIYGEQEFQVGPLALPATPASPYAQPATLPPSAAMTLFVERARLVRPTFALAPDNAQDIAALCVLLDGLPLAIEMAAARIRQATPRQLLEQLRQRAAPLSDGLRGRDPRQQSMHSAIAWSYRLLQPNEQRLFETLSVFAGGCTLAALTALSPQPDDALQSLIDKSLLQVQPSTDETLPMRYSLLHVVREFAQVCLVESGCESDVREAHLRYFAQFAEDCERQMSQPGAAQVQMMNLMEAEHNNVRAALEWALHEQGDRALGVRLASAYGWFWLMRGYVNEALDHLQRVLEFTRHLQQPPLLAKALERAGALAAFRADLNLARTMLSECVDVARACGSAATVTLGEGLWELGVVLRRQRQFALARQALEESIAHGRQHGLPFVLDAALAYLGDVCSQEGQPEEAQRYLNEALDIATQINDIWGIGLSLRVMGDALQKQGDHAAATAAYLRSLPPARAIGDRINQAFALSNLAVIANLQGDFAASRTHADEGLHILHSTGLHQHIPFLERMLAYAEVQLGNLDRAAQVCAQSLRSNIALGHPTGIAGNWLCQAEIALAHGDAAAARQLLHQAQTLAGDLSHLVRPDAQSFARLCAHLAPPPAPLPPLSF